MTDAEYKSSLNNLTNAELLRTYTDLVLTVERVAEENTPLSEKQFKFTAVLEAIMQRMK
jgi:hypothetical protein